MRPLFALFLIGLSLLSSGCALVVDATRNLAVSLAKPIEKKREWYRDYEWAEQAWLEHGPEDGAGPYSEDYATGFKDGFAEYLFRGGNGEPPLLPPLCYRRFKYQNPQGYRAIDDWFAGYRHGAAVAKRSGAREWITGPSSLRAGLIDAPPPPAPAVQATEVPSAPPKVQPQLLPAPRLIPDAAPQKQSAAPAPDVPVVVPLGVSPGPPPRVVPLDARSVTAPVESAS